MLQSLNRIISPKHMRVLAWLIIIAGAIARIYIYIQNRNLIIDESNVARNLYERGFVDLAKPLSYEQYAPPIYLWITKISSILFGFSEQALRLYPLLCGIGALYLMYRVLKEFLPVSTVWYPLSLFAFAHILIRYSSELKQYMPDVFICLLLILLALKIDQFRKKSLHFAILWVAIGTLAIWSSMPSVFILAGIGVYYFGQAIQAKAHKKLIPLFIIGGLWLVQFGIYYYTILSAQANSGYLQGFHQNWFLYATPNDITQLKHNIAVFNLLMFQFEGVNLFIHSINLVLFIAGIILLFYRTGAKAFLVVLPIALMLVAASVNQYSLIPRVALFSIPLLIIVIGYGFGQMANFKSPLLKILFVGIGILCGYYNIKNTLEKDEFKYEEITTGLQFLDDNGLPGNSITIFSHSVPAFKYYTQIHPDSTRWERVKNADLYNRNSDFDSLAYHMRFLWQSRVPLGFVYTNATELELRQHDQSFRKLLILQDSVVKPYVQSFIYIRPLEDENNSERFR